MKNQKRAKLFRITAALMGSASFVRGDGTPPNNAPNEQPNNDQGGERRMTQAQWEAQRQQELAARTHADLVAQLIRVETDAHNLRRRQVPDGGRILTREEAQRYEQYTALGEDPAAIRAELDTGRNARTSLAQRERGDQIREAAEVVGYNPRVLQTLIPEGAELVINPPAAGQTARTVALRLPGENGQLGAPVALNEHATASWADFIPALTTRPGQSAPTPNPARPGFVAQDSGGTPTSGTAGSSWVAQSLQTQAPTGYRDPLQPGNVGQPTAAAPAASTQQGS